MADARRLAAELGAVLADAATVGSVGEQVSAAVRERLGATHVVINVLGRDGQRFEQLAGSGAAAQVAAMDAEWTIGADAPGPRAVRDGTAVYLPDRTAPGSGFADVQQVGEALGLASSAAFPLLTEVGALGYLGVWWAEPHATTPVEREYLLGMAETASRALERAKLREAERRERARVENAVRTDRAAGRGADPRGDRRRGDRPRPRGPRRGRRPVARRDQSGSPAARMGHGRWLSGGDPRMVLPGAAERADGGDRRRPDRAARGHQDARGV